MDPHSDSVVTALSRLRRSLSDHIIEKQRLGFGSARESPAPVCSPYSNNGAELYVLTGVAKSLVDFVWAAFGIHCHSYASGRLSYLVAHLKVLEFALGRIPAPSSRLCQGETRPVRFFSCEASEPEGRRM